MLELTCWITQGTSNYLQRFSAIVHRFVCGFVFVTCIQRGFFLAPEKEGLEGLGPREGGLLKLLVVKRRRSAVTSTTNKINWFLY